MGGDDKAFLEGKIARYEQEFSQLEKDNDALMSALNRLSVSLNGRHNEIDKQLNELRRILKRKKNIEHIVNVAEKITGYFADLDEAETEILGVSFVSNLLDSLFDNHVISAREKRKIDKAINKGYQEKDIYEAFLALFAKKIDQIATSSEEDVDDDIDDEDLDEIKNEQLHDEQHGALSKKDNFTAGNLSSQSAMYCNKELIISLKELISAIIVPDDLKEQQTTIANRLNNKLDLNELETIISDIASLVIQSVNVERDKFKLFLENLSINFAGVNQFLQYSLDENAERENNTITLQSAIESDIGEMKNKYRNLSNLNELISVVDSGLMSISSKLKEYHNTEKSKREAYEKEILILNDKVKAIEKRSDELHASLIMTRDKAQRDSLTGLLNRESYDDYMNLVMKRVESPDNQLIIAVADIDHFKNINDSYGHLAGDKVLSVVANIMKQTIRENDFIARYGGEEFVLVFENTAMDKADKILNKLRTLISEHVFHFKGQDLKVTISFGFTLVKTTDNKEEAFDRADKALYTAKNEGRNKVVFA